MDFCTNKQETLKEKYVIVNLMKEFNDLYLNFDKIKLKSFKFVIFM